jgi:hypothetical protein
MIMQSSTSPISEDTVELPGLEHVQIKPEDLKEKIALLEKGGELKDRTKSYYEIFTRRVSPNHQEYATSMSKPVPRRNCMEPSGLETIAIQITEKPEEAVQFHFDVLKYFNDLGY